MNIICIDKIYEVQTNETQAETSLLTSPISFILFLKNFMTPFYGWGSTASRVQNHYDGTVYFLLLSPQKFLVLI